MTTVFFAESVGASSVRTRPRLRGFSKEQTLADSGVRKRVRYARDVKSDRSAIARAREAIA